MSSDILNQLLSEIPIHTKVSCTTWSLPPVRPLSPSSSSPTSPTTWTTVSSLFSLNPPSNASFQCVNLSSINVKKFNPESFNLEIVVKSQLLLHIWTYSHLISIDCSLQCTALGTCIVSSWTANPAPSSRLWSRSCWGVTPPTTAWTTSSSCLPTTWSGSTPPCWRQTSGCL